MADLVAPIPVIAIGGGGEIRFEAVDATTGAPVSGVTVSAATISAVDLSDDGTDASSPTNTAVLLPGPAV